MHFHEFCTHGCICMRLRVLVIDTIDMALWTVAPVRVAAIDYCRYGLLLW